MGKDESRHALTPCRSPNPLSKTPRCLSQRASAARSGGTAESGPVVPVELQSSGPGERYRLKRLKPTLAPLTIISRSFPPRRQTGIFSLRTSAEATRCICLGRQTARTPAPPANGAGNTSSRLATGPPIHAPELAGAGDPAYHCTSTPGLSMSARARPVNPVTQSWAI